jgi:predicted nucleic acid-binding Zn ribbon protein
MSQIPRERRARIPDHRHCVICGRPVPPKEELCSDECRGVYQDRLKRERRSRVMLLILYVALMASLFLIFFWPR